LDNNKIPLKRLLYSDLARQAELEGRPVARPGIVRLLRRLLHPRFLPIVICRASRTTRLRKIPVLPELLTYLNIVLFGLEVTPRCEIGPGGLPATCRERLRSATYHLRLGRMMQGLRD